MNHGEPRWMGGIHPKQLKNLWTLSIEWLVMAGLRRLTLRNVDYSWLFYMSSPTIRPDLRRNFLAKWDLDQLNMENIIINDSALQWVADPSSWGIPSPRAFDRSWWHVATISPCWGRTWWIVGWATHQWNPGLVTGSYPQIFHFWDVIPTKHLPVGRACHAQAPHQENDLLREKAPHARSRIC